MRIALGLLVLLLSLPASPLSAAQQKDKKGETRLSTTTVVGGKTLSEWKKELGHPDASRRSHAIMAIVEFGDASSECVPLLIKLLNDRDVSPRCKALHALNMVAIDEKDVPAVVKAVTTRISRDHEIQAIVRLEAARTLGRFIPQASSSIPTLIATLGYEGSSWEIRYQIVGLLWRIGVDSKDTSGRIHMALRSRLIPENETTHQVRLEALIGLGAMPRPDNPAILARVIDDLIKVTNWKDKTLAIWAYVALVVMQDNKPAEKSLTAIAKYVDNSENHDVRVQAIAALGALGKQARTKQARVMELLEDSENVIAQTACFSLSRICEKNDDGVITALLKMTDHKEVARAGAAVMALITMRPDGTKVIAKLDKMLEKKDLNLNLRALIEAGLKELRNPEKKK